jgi:hypothetical protein
MNYVRRREEDSRLRTAVRRRYKRFGEYFRR